MDIKMFVTKTAIKRSGRKAAIAEGANRCSPHGILLKKGINGGKLPNVKIIIAITGIKKSNESIIDMRIN